MHPFAPKTVSCIMKGITMLNISRWTGQGGSYRTVKGFSTLLSLQFAGRFFALICLIESDNRRRSGCAKSGKKWKQSDPRFVVFSRVLSEFDQSVPTRWLWTSCVADRQIGVCARQGSPKHKRGRPKGSRNRTLSCSVMC